MKEEVKTEVTEEIEIKIDEEEIDNNEEFKTMGRGEVDGNLE